MWVEAGNGLKQHLRDKHGGFAPTLADFPFESRFAVCGIFGRCGTAGGPTPTVPWTQELQGYPTQRPQAEQILCCSRVAGDRFFLSDSFECFAPVSLEHQSFRFAKVVLRDKCSALYDLASPFRVRPSA